jgi:hypothetical protein
MKSSYCFVACTFLLFFPLNTKALDYPSALPNNNLEEEIRNQNDRMVPKSDWFSAALDGQVYFRNLEANDFYHGTDHWVQARTEFRPSQLFTLNVRSIFFSGSISGGYSKPTGQYNLFGFSATWPKPVLGGTIEARAIDLERQTIGQGLFIEEKEMAGVWVKWTRDDHYLKIMKEGTGGLVMGDDLTDIEAKLFGGHIGAGVILWTQSVEQSGMDQNRKPFYFLNSAHALGSYVDYFAELGFRFSKFAGMIGLKSEGTTGRLKYKSRIQARSYQENVGNEFVGMIDNTYVSYDQYNKRYTNAGNIFVTDDNVNVYSIVMDLDYELNHEWEIQSKNEVGTFDYKYSKNKGFYFYRFGLTYFPLIDREESITLFTSNKVLTDSFSRPPSDYSNGKNLPLFRQRSFYGVEASFRF